MSDVEVEGMLDSLLKTFTEYSSDAGEIVIKLLHQVHKEPSVAQTTALPDYQQTFLNHLQGQRMNTRPSLISSTPKCSQNSTSPQLSLTPVSNRLQQISLQTPHKRKAGNSYNSASPPKQNKLDEQENEEKPEEANEEEEEQKEEEEAAAIAKLSEWFPLVSSSNRPKIEEMGLKMEEMREQVGNDMLGLYNGLENFQHVMKFVEETIDVATKSNEMVGLFICSPFYVSSLNSWKPEECFKSLMNVILKAPTKKLRVKFFTRSKQFSTAVMNTLVDTELQKLFSKAIEDGKIEVMVSNESDTKRYFHCKWLARVEESNVQLLITSANVTDSHLLVEEQWNGFQQLDSMERKSIGLDYFQVMFLIPILQVCKTDTSILELCESKSFCKKLNFEDSPTVKQTESSNSESDSSQAENSQVEQESSQVEKENSQVEKESSQVEKESSQIESESNQSESRERGQTENERDQAENKSCEIEMEHKLLL